LSEKGEISPFSRYKGTEIIKGIQKKLYITNTTVYCINVQNKLVI
jgi:hypothetical protein